MRKISIIAFILILLLLLGMSVNASTGIVIETPSATGTHLFQAAPTGTGHPTIAPPNGTSVGVTPISPTAQPTYTAEPEP